MGEAPSTKYQIAIKAKIMVQEEQILEELQQLRLAFSLSTPHPEECRKKVADAV